MEIEVRVTVDVLKFFNDNALEEESTPNSAASPMYGQDHRTLSLLNHHSKNETTTLCSMGTNQAGANATSPSPFEAQTLILTGHRAGPNLRTYLVYLHILCFVERLVI
jgi:hypothetical protein